MGRVIKSSSISSKAMLAFMLVFVVLGVTVFVEGVRDLKDEQQVKHPDNFFAGGGAFPSPGTTLPGFGGPSTGPGVGSSVDFCSLPGVGCVRVQPTNPGSIGGQVGGNTPLPFP